MNEMNAIHLVVGRSPLERHWLCRVNRNRVILPKGHENINRFLNRLEDHREWCVVRGAWCVGSLSNAQRTTYDALFLGQRPPKLAPGERRGADLGLLRMKGVHAPITCASDAIQQRSQTRSSVRDIGTSLIPPITDNDDPLNRGDRMMLGSAILIAEDARMVRRCEPARTNPL